MPLHLVLPKVPHYCVWSAHWRGIWWPWWGCPHTPQLWVPTRNVGTESLKWCAHGHTTTWYTTFQMLWSPSHPKSTNSLYLLPGPRESSPSLSMFPFFNARNKIPRLVSGEIFGHTPLRSQCFPSPTGSVLTFFAFFSFTNLFKFLSSDR